MRKKIAEKLSRKVVEDFDNIAEEFDKTRKSNWKEFDSFLPYIKDNQILIDLGCGNGRFFHFIKKHRKIKYLGIDKSKKLIEKACEALKNTQNNNETKFIEGDILKIPVDNNFADVVSAIASIHHIPSQELQGKAIHEIHRILKPDGIAIITVWNLYQPKYRKYIWYSWIKWLLSLGAYDINDVFIPWGNSGIKRYYHAFTKNKLERLIKKNGFEIIKYEITDNIIFICKKRKKLKF
jgi:alkylated DNA repair protein alkB family protein 8